jgi:hypothetical protein
MTRWQLTGLVVGAAALLFTARPAQAQAWFGPPVGVVPGPVVRPVPPIGVIPGPVVTPPVWPVPPVGVVPPIGVVPGPVVVGPGWGARPRDVRRAYRTARRAGWYGAARGPRGGVVVVGGGW